MAKRKETLGIEEALYKDTKEKRIYGCEEVTIGFYNNGHGNEIVDFITMDSKCIIKCYEIKVTLQDLKSKAKKSWYGHYNYLVVSRELYDKVDDWNMYLPSNVGLIIGYQQNYNGTEYYTLSSNIRSKRTDINKETEIMLKESMVRSIYFKMCKYKGYSDIDKQQKLNKYVSSLEKENKRLKQKETEYQNEKYTVSKLYLDKYVDTNTHSRAWSKMLEDANNIKETNTFDF